MEGGAFGTRSIVIIQIMQVCCPSTGRSHTYDGSFGFWPALGVVLNYVGVCIGSGINFYLARQYGKRLVTQW